jgi:EmrB/QacA subfamily drug resistance transporter
LAVILTASFLGVLDFFIVNVSIPSIQDTLYASFGEIQMVIACYGLAYAVFLITGGRLGDLYGRKRMFLLGMAGFTLASALCGFATSPQMLIVSRVLQGLAGAMMFPQVLSIIQVTFPPAERTRAFSILGVVVGAGSFSGNVLGGLLVEGNLLGLGWRPIFLVNLPIGIVALIAAGILLHESRALHAARPDLVGVVIASVGLFLLLFPLIEGREAAWPLPWTLGMLALSLVMLVVFLGFEWWLTKRGGTPLVELGLFRDRTFVVGLLTSGAFYGGLSAFFLTFTLFLQDGLRLSPRNAGLTFAPFALGFLSSSLVAVKLASRMGRRSIQLGACMMILGLISFVLLARIWGCDLPVGLLIPLLFVYGAGQGLVVPTLLATVLSGIPSRAAGSASGVLTTTQQVAINLGVAGIGSIYFAVLGSQHEAGGFVSAVATSLLCNIGLLATTCVLVFLLPLRPADVAPMHVDL